MSSENDILAALRASRPRLLSAFGFGFFINALMLAVPLYSMQVLDRVLSSGSFDTLLMLSLIAAFALLFMGLLQGLRSLVFSHVRRWFDDRLAWNLVGKTVELARYSPGAGTQPLRDLATLKHFITSPALSSAVDAPWAIIYLVAIFLIHQTLGIALLVGALVLLVLALLAEKLPARLSAQANEDQVKSLQALDTVIQNAEVVKAMGLLNAAARPWRQHNRESLAKGFQAGHLAMVIAQVTRTLRMGIQVLLTGWGAYFVLEGQMSAGGIIAVSILSGKALAPFDAAVSIYQGWVSVKQAYGRLAVLYQQVPDSVPTLGLPSPVGRLSIDKLTYQDPHSCRWLLRGVNLELKAGESLGVVGPSGAGKTTLARLLAGVLTPTSGRVNLDGAALQQWDSEQRGNSMGYLPQRVELFEGTIAQNIARLDEDGDDSKVVEAAQMAQVHEAILALPQGYQTEIGNQGAWLSAGQRQRIGLARCFYGEVKWVVLDEPNANLDSEGELALRRCLRRAKQRGITTVTIAHRPSLLQAVDKVLVLDAGEAVMFGPAQRVLAKLVSAERTTQSASTHIGIVQ